MQADFSFLKSDGLGSFQALSRRCADRVHLAACKAGAGVAILPSQVVDRDAELTCLLRPEHVLTLGLFLVVHRELARTARIRAVAEFRAGLAPKRR